MLLFLFSLLLQALNLQFFSEIKWKEAINMHTHFFQIVILFSTDLHNFESFEQFTGDLEYQHVKPLISNDQHELVYFLFLIFLK